MLFSPLLSLTAFVVPCAVLPLLSLVDVLFSSLLSLVGVLLSPAVLAFVVPCWCAVLAFVVPCWCAVLAFVVLRCCSRLCCPLWMCYSRLCCPLCCRLCCPLLVCCCRLCCPLLVRAKVRPSAPRLVDHHITIPYSSCSLVRNPLFCQLSLLSMIIVSLHRIPLHLLSTRLTRYDILNSHRPPAKRTTQFSFPPTHTWRHLRFAASKVVLFLLLLFLVSVLFSPLCCSHLCCPL